jgi:glycosyltransferase involved in cell wall biosynthesis
MVSISYCITVCNEHEELERLVSLLILRMKFQDEIVIQVDSSNVTKEVLEVVAQEQNMSSRIKLVKFPLNKDFANFKNNAYKQCTKDYIFQIDADEYPSDTLIDNIHSILEINPTLELVLVPRVNTVQGLTEAHIQKWGWNINDKGWINYPDYQTRISKNISEIYWVGKVHERLMNRNYARIINDFLPTYHDLDLIHAKNIEKQEKQNKFYESI